MSEKIIGRILPNPRGKWNKDITYEKMDFVMFEGNGYVCRKTCINSQPDMYPLTWVKISEKGEKGDRGEKGNNQDFSPNYKNKWSPDVLYDKYDIVTYEGSSWMCLRSSSIGVQPGTSPSEYSNLKLEAEDCSAKYGNAHVEKILVGDDLTGEIKNGTRLIEIRNNDWISFKNVELGKGMTKLCFTYSSIQPTTSTVEVYLNYMNDKIDPITKFQITSTDDDKKYKTVIVDVNPYYFKETKTVYLKFVNNETSSNNSDLCSVDYIEFNNSENETGNHWGLMSKGIDYSLDKLFDELDFKHGVKSYYDNIYSKDDDEALSKKIRYIYRQLKKMKSIFENMDMWNDSETGDTTTQDIKLEDKSIELAENGEYTVDYDKSHYDGLNKVNIHVNVPEPEHAIKLQEKAIKPTQVKQIVIPDKNYDGLSKVIVNGVNAGSKSVSPKKYDQTINPDPYEYMTSVEISKVTSDIDKNIKPENIINGVEILGVQGNYKYTSTDGEKFGYTKRTDFANLNFEPRTGNNLENMFINAEFESPEFTIDATHAESAQSMFSNCTSLRKLPKLLNINNIQSFEYFCLKCGLLEDISEIENWDFSKCKNTHYMFSECSNLTGEFISNESENENGEKHNVLENAEGMFDSTGLNRIEINSTFDKLVNMSDFCSQCENLKYVKLGTFAQGLSDARGMFWCDNIDEIYMGTPEHPVKLHGNCSNMFVGLSYEQNKLNNLTKNVYIDISECTNTGSMFKNTLLPERYEDFITGQLSPNNKNISAMFALTKGLKDITHLNINCSDEIDCALMFYETSVEKIGTVTISGSKAGRLLEGAKNVKYIKEIICPDATSESMKTLLKSCINLVDLGGLTGLKTSIQLQYNKLLKKQSYLNVFNTCADLTSQPTQTMTISQEGRNLLSDDDIKIATDKNWTITVVG